MKILYYECFSGISGDMNLAALIGLGVDEEWLRAQLARLPIPEPWELRVRPGQKSGISGLTVKVLETVHEHEHEHEHGHGHEHEHGHGHEHEHGHGHGHEHEHRRLREMETLIQAAALPPKVKTAALEVLRALAAAEAEVHGTDLYSVTLHEVSGLDTIVDIVGAALCLEYLAVDEIWSSPVELGGGFVRCAHGLLPVPAPAVQNLLRGVPVTLGRVAAETTTPTGAAIIKTFAHRFPARPAFTPLRAAYGLGERDLPVPNALRVTLAEAETSGAETAYERATQYVLETNIDDMDPEALAYAEELLLRAGALDVWRVACHMKKGRLGVTLGLLAREQEVPALRDIILRETTAIGLRLHPVEKIMLPRKIRSVVTPWGEARLKECALPDGTVKTKPEFEDCRRLAAEAGIPLRLAAEMISRRGEESR
ncbi:MAG: nickel pincer cofactor biosynthesis protein LarC [Gracilibacteraceae bacterium]|jgi:uncharacterized protein (TIGR00299 family) protein|nr:nickel pincer cofactor biosynthesis protein LarC [Gracilibacteraceae bacterium]